MYQLYTSERGGGGSGGGQSSSTGSKPTSTSARLSACSQSHHLPSEQPTSTRTTPAPASTGSAARPSPPRTALPPAVTGPAQPRRQTMRERSSLQCNSSIQPNKMLLSPKNARGIYRSGSIRMWRVVCCWTAKKKKKKQKVVTKNSTTEFSIRRLRETVFSFRMTEVAGRIFIIIPNAFIWTCTKLNPMSFRYHAKMSKITSIRCYVIFYSILCLSILFYFVVVVLFVCLFFSEQLCWVTDFTVVELQVLSGESLTLYKGEYQSLSKCKMIASDGCVKAFLLL